MEIGKDKQSTRWMQAFPKQKDPDGCGGCEGYANSCIYPEKETDAVDSRHQDTGSVRE